MRHAPGEQTSFHYEYVVRVRQPDDSPCWQLRQALKRMLGQEDELPYSFTNDREEPWMETSFTWLQAPDDGGCKRIMDEIWNATGQYLLVEIEATYVESQPCGKFESEIEDYRAPGGNS